MVSAIEHAVIEHLLPGIYLSFYSIVDGVGKNRWQRIELLIFDASSINFIHQKYIYKSEQIAKGATLD